MRKLLSLTFLLLAINFTNINCKGQAVNADYVLKKIKRGKDIVIQNKTINGTVDFTRINLIDLSPQVATAQIPANIVFINCHFTDSIVAYKNTKNKAVFTQFLQNVSFINCTFDAPVILRQAEFYKNLRIQDNTFNAQFDFSGVSVKSPKTYFNENLFKGTAKFMSGFYLGQINFMDNTMEQTCDFTGSIFNQLANFSNSDFQYASFYNIKANDLIFNYIKTNGKFILADAIINGRVEFIKPQIHNKFILKNLQINSYLKIFEPKIDSTAQVIYQNIQINNQEKSIIPQTIQQNK